MKQRKRESHPTSRTYIIFVLILAIYFIVILYTNTRLYNDDESIPSMKKTSTSKNAEAKVKNDKGGGATKEIKKYSNKNAKTREDGVIHAEAGNVLEIRNERNPKKESPLTMGGGALNKDSNPDEKEEESNRHDEISELLASIHPNRENIVLTAYMEPAMQFYTDPNPPTVPGKKDDRQAPLGDLVIPLPLRTHAPSDLKKALYSKLRTCSDLPHRLPVDPGLDKKGENFILNNVNNKSPIYPSRLEEYEEYCPVDSDPFLPWIHDIFSSPKGDAIHVISQNKRRCNTGGRFYGDVWNLNPQISIMQPVAVRRVDEDIVVGGGATKDLWHPGKGAAEKQVRYALSTHDDADEDGKTTRFLCRFHSGVSSTAGDEKGSEAGTIVFGETLSVHPINYEYVDSLKGEIIMLSKRGKDNGKFWLANFQFDCPVPDHLHPHVKDGMAEGRIYLDIVPIRTAPRFGETFVQDYKVTFDANTIWGKDHVLPRIEASGRWENIPVCTSPPYKEGINTKHDQIDDRKTQQQMDSTSVDENKPYNLVGCVWASASYSTRNNYVDVSDTQSRLIEWIEFHLLVGFDHFYIYDNSGAHHGGGDLSPIVDLFGADVVTLIPWIFRPCNNNAPAHENSGERSSQYAAESSCRARYGSYTNWMANFDPDEYFVPMGKYTNLKELLNHAEKGGTKILSFRSTRAFPNQDLMIPHHDDDKCKRTASKYPACLAKNPDITFLQAYNCESHPSGLKPARAIRAKKQIYRPDYVLSHFVHYSTITEGMLLHQRRSENAPIERFTNEAHEAIMVHAKTTDAPDTKLWFDTCRSDFEHKHIEDRCRIGFVWPGNKEDKNNTFSKDGWLYNSWKNERVEEIFIPKLIYAMERRKRKLPTVDIVGR